MDHDTRTCERCGGHSLAADKEIAGLGDLTRERDQYKAEARDLRARAEAAEARAARLEQECEARTASESKATAEANAWRLRAEAAEAELAQATRMLDAQTEGTQAGDAGLGPEANPYPADPDGTIGPATMWEVARGGATNYTHTEALAKDLLARAEAAEAALAALRAAAGAWLDADLALCAQDRTTEMVKTCAEARDRVRALVNAGEAQHR